MKVGNLMVPRYTQHEISKRIQLLIKMENYDLDESTKHKLFNPSLIWISNDFKVAAKLLGTTPEKLLSHLPAEDLSSISFRALENTNEINQKVTQLEDIFQLLTYQLKIGSD